MSWHYYCWLLGDGSDGGRQSPYDPIKKAVCDDLMGPMVFNTATVQARKIGGGQMLTEVILLMPINFLTFNVVF